MSILSTLVGALLIVVGLRDIFQELFKPNSYGRLSHFIMRNTWHAFQKMATYNRRILVFAGPINLISIILSWVVLLAIGWALVIWPQMPAAFLLSSGMAPGKNGGFIDALYVSIVTLVTLGYGDITPTSDWLRIFLPLEALVGFILLTASITWVLSVYPVIDRRRSLAHTISLIRRLEGESGAFGKDNEDAQTLESLASQVITIQGDLNRFPVTYYFYEENEHTALPAVMPELLHMAEQGACADQHALRRRAALLQHALEDFSDVLVNRGFVNASQESVDAVLQAYARDHFYTPKTLHSSAPAAKT